MRADLIVASLEAAAERCADLTPLVYARLFRDRPELAPLFRKDAGLVQGEMLARSLESILDFVEGDAYASALIAAEATTHASYEVPRETFAAFFGVIADTLRDTLGADWSAETDRAWRELLAAIADRARIEEAHA